MIRLCATALAAAASLGPWQCLLADGLWPTGYGDSASNPAGAGLGYDDHWAGRYRSIENNPFPATLDSSDTDLGGFTTGALYAWSDSTRIGVNYHSELSTDLGGPLELWGLGVTVETNSERTFAHNMRLGIYHQLSDRLALDLSLGWDDWSALDKGFVAVGSTGASLEKYSRDTSHAALGFQYQLNPRWLLTGTVAYDTSQMESQFRTADMPLDRQLRVAVGGELTLTESLSVGGYVNYADVGRARIVATQFQGEYNSAEIYQLGMRARWHF